MMRIIVIGLFLCIFSLGHAQDEVKKDDPWSADRFSGLTLRNIGPALMAGRISDIAIHPENENVWYVAVGSGGVWKTENAGTTWTPIFDHQNVYSIGCVTIDPHHPSTIYVGTGENVGGRHVGFGDGIYRSEDGGKNWQHLGLKKSEHISKIIVHPTDANTVFVAAQGPLWSQGGDRGFFVTHDHGQSWTKTLGDDQWTGVTDIVIDPRNPDRVYAATWQRHRTVAAFMGGGPKSGIHRSEDGGQTWVWMKDGLPKSNMGKIGLAISPQNPDIVYAAVELDLRTGGVYRSVDRGQTWEKRSDAVAGATGPHYYQELYACPHHEGRLYLVDVWMQVSDDGGKTFHRMKEKFKHPDNHAVAFKKSDPHYLLVGTDGGLYESFDDHEHWHFFDNMPITQFYKLAVDDAEPFYRVYGGTQDNSTQGGPSRTDKVNGIQNRDWKVVLDWDGHQPATEPGNPNIMYGQRQEGTLSRIDLSTGEVIDIQPQPEADESYERFNWDAPILVSPHDPAQLFFASQRVWRSNDRGDSWTAISPDLTKNQNRWELPIMGRKQSWENPWDLLAMSNYNTITSIAESPVVRDHIMVGTDDGSLHHTEDGGAHWTKIDIQRLPGVPSSAYVNDVKADLFDATVWYVALDNHKVGDFTPYLYKTRDNGKTWTSLTSNLKAPNLVWRVVQDHIQKDLLFIGTEFGVFFTVDGGQRWIQLKGELPTISFRDLTIQRRENDLVCASFGRGIYILDDIVPFRSVNEDIIRSKAHLFPVRDAWWYVPRPDLSFGSKKGFQGSAYFSADNPPFGAVFTAYMGQELTTPSQDRKKHEKKLNEEGKDVPFPGWDALDEEKLETRPVLVFVVRDATGQVVRKVQTEAKKGFQRINWDLRYPNPRSLTVGDKKSKGRGYMAPPGKYTVEMYLHDEDGWQSMGGPQAFEVKRMYPGTLEGAPLSEVSDFQRQYENALSVSSSLKRRLMRAQERVETAQVVIQEALVMDEQISQSAHELQRELFYLERDLSGSPNIKKPGEKTPPTLDERMFAIDRGISNSTYGPTSTHRRQMQIVEDILEQAVERMSVLEDRLNVLVQNIEEQGGVPIED